jgi:hypothetical protein
MATVEFIHFCDYAFLDDRGHPCLIGVHGSVSVSGFPHTVAQLTVAIGVRIKSGEEAHIRAEIGPVDGKPQRAANFKLNGPPADGPLAEGLNFLPFANMTLFFNRPHVMLAKVIDQTNNNVLAQKKLAIVLDPTPRP